VNGNNETEEKVKALIREALHRRIAGWESIDPDLGSSSLVERWLSDIMAIGFNDQDLGRASVDVFELQKPLEGLTIPQVLLEDIRGRIHLSSDRFPDEVAAFMTYIELRDEESEEVILFKVREELQYVEKGGFHLI
jgi:hypothetical protein